MLTACKVLTTVLFACLFLSPFAAWGISPTNGSANSANNGLAVAADDGSIYYLDLTGDVYAGGQENIYCLQSGSKPPSLLSADEAWNLTISGKYLYYSNWSDQHSIYRLDLTTNTTTRITSQPASQLTSAGNLLLFCSRDSSGNGVYKLALDAQAQPQLIINDQAENLMIAGDWVYYLNAADNYRIYKIKLDGTGRTKLSDDQVLFMAIAGTSIYYSNNSDSQKLYSLNFDGQGRTKLTDDKAGFINVFGDYIYYTNASANHALYRMHINNHTRRQLVCDLNIGPQPILLVNNLVYYNRLFFKP